MYGNVAQISAHPSAIAAPELPFAAWRRGLAARFGLFKALLLVLLVLSILLFGEHLAHFGIARSFNVFGHSQPLLAGFLRLLVLRLMLDGMVGIDLQELLVLLITQAEVLALLVGQAFGARFGGEPLCRRRIGAPTRTRLRLQSHLADKGEAKHQQSRQKKSDSHNRVILVNKHPLDAVRHPPFNCWCVKQC